MSSPFGQIGITEENECQLEKKRKQASTLQRRKTGVTGLTPRIATYADGRLWTLEVESWTLNVFRIWKDHGHRIRCPCHPTSEKHFLSHSDFDIDSDFGFRHSD